VKFVKKIAIVFLAFLMLSQPVIAIADDGTLTLQEAIELALEHDSTLKKAQAEIDRTRELRKKAQENVRFTPAIGGVYGPQIEVSWYNLLQADLSYRMSLKDYDTKIDVIELDVCKKYWDVQSASEELAVQEKLKEQALINLQNVRAGVAAGSVPAYMLSIAEAQYEQAVKNYEQAQHALDVAYTAFNQAVGLDPEARPALTDEVKYEPLEVVSLDSEVSRVLANAPNVWQARQMIDLKTWASSMMYYTGNYTPYEAREKEREEAELDYNTVKDLMAKATRTIYYQTKQLEEGYSAALEALKMAEEQLRVAKANYEVGMGIKADVVSAEVAVAQAKVAVDELVRQHAYLKLAFEKPWAMSGGN
jgi:outer membrane protein TolC